MSADNWAVCPRCKKRRAAERLAKQEAAAKAYGKVPADEWQRMTAEANAAHDDEEELREDYTIHTDETGEFYVGYRCVCQRCGFEHRFKHTEQLNISAAGE